jgi:DNA-binding response OmpR family regulator
MRLLLVEDSAPLRQPVVKALKASGYAVDATGDGAEGWEMTKDHDYDVIILDIMLPGMDGHELLRRMRAAGNETPVLFLTAKDAIAERVAGLRLGADDYLTKSFAIDELLARVEALGRRKYARRSPHLVVGDLELDQAAKTVRRRGARSPCRPSFSPCWNTCCCAKVRWSRERKSRSTSMMNWYHR